MSCPASFRRKDILGEGGGMVEEKRDEEENGPKPEHWGCSCRCRVAGLVSQKQRNGILNVSGGRKRG